MNHLTKFAEIGDTVTYNGENRDKLRNREGTVVNFKPGATVSLDSLTVSMNDTGDIAYGARWAWEVVSKPTISEVAETTDLEKVFSDAAGGPRVVAENEISRLQARIDELKKFIEVYDSL